MEMLGRVGSEYSPGLPHKYITRRKTVITWHCFFDIYRKLV